MKDRYRLVVVAVSTALVVIVAALAVWLIGRAWNRGIDQIRLAGEAPLATEEIWIAPTPDAQDWAAQEAEALENLPDPEGSIPTAQPEDVISVPVLETPEELAQAPAADAAEDGQTPPEG